MNETTLRHFWIAFIAVTCINAWIYKKRSRYYIEKNPDLAEGYAKLIRGYLIWLNIPWVIMGLGLTVGGVPSMAHYFQPKDGNPFVLAWFASVFLLWILGTFWLFFKGGAKTLAKYPGAIEFHSPFSKTEEITSPAVIKLIWCVCLLGGIVGVVMLWNRSIPTQ